VTLENDKGERRTSLGVDLERAMKVAARFERTGVRFFDPEVRRVRGSLLADRGDVAEAELQFIDAISITRDQGAKHWELRAFRKTIFEIGNIEQRRVALHMLGAGTILAQKGKLLERERERTGHIPAGPHRGALSRSYALCLDGSPNSLSLNHQVNTVIADFPGARNSVA
jgi:hypothetical protein